MSTLIISSSESSAAAMRGPFGVERTGLLAIVTSARTWPSPGVSISSARQVIGSSPNTSGAPETRLVRRPSGMPLPELGGLGAARIDHDELAAARLHRLRLAAEVGHRPHAAVRRERVRAEHDEQLRALEIGDRDAEPVAEHQAARELLRHLIERGRRE